MGFDENYIKYFFRSGWDNEMMIAFLSQLPFDTFEENKKGITAYLPASKVDNKLKKEIEEICGKYKLSFDKEEIENKNWNREWESNFEPVIVDSFCLIKANFHKGLQEDMFKHVINITPEMTFGTGHHETTYMMIEMMSNLYLIDKAIFDFGSGTGILSVLAEKMGAKSIFAIDNDPIAVENISKNANANNCSKIEANFGDNAENEKFVFDVVLANINRNVLMTEASNLSLSLRKGGFLLLSGILIEDKNFIINVFEDNSMKMMGVIEKGKWCAMKFVAY